MSPYTYTDHPEAFPQPAQPEEASQPGAFLDGLFSPNDLQDAFNGYLRDVGAERAKPEAARILKAEHDHAKKMTAFEAAITEAFNNQEN